MPIHIHMLSPPLTCHAVCARCMHMELCLQEMIEPMCILNYEAVHGAYMCMQAGMDYNLLLPLLASLLAPLIEPSF